MDNYEPNEIKPKWLRTRAKLGTGRVENYNPAKIEEKWQEYWDKNQLFKAEDFSKKPKKYILIEFPYPSGDGLHVGHVRSYAALDAVARKARMEGSNVLYPIGWDAFGLPTENYAIKTGVHPAKATKKNVANFTRQFKSLGLSFDWSREINTTDPDYYRWTQWIFLKLFGKGLAYQAEIPINWCPSCKIGLANEEVVDGKCERCGTEARKKVLKQWMIKITAYADRLIEDLEKVDYLEKVKAQQINWIGKSFGTEIDFKVENSADIIKVFTTRTDTLFGVTAIVLAPEHPIVASLLKIKNQKSNIKNYKEVKNYIKQSEKKSEFERTELAKEKTGVELKGVKAINPVDNEKVPIWIGDYVVATYGGGAVMMVPAHDQRDWEFAKKYNLNIKPVVLPRGQSFDPENLKSYPKEIKNIDEDPFFKLAIDKIMNDEAFCGEGFNINSNNNDINLNFLSTQEAIGKITEWLEKNKLGRKTIQYKLRDWVFSRQHYWGEPIPIVHCSKCGQVAVPEKDLPVGLPYVEKYQPTGTGESPLSAISDWVNTKCPKCKGVAKRETDTMPNWAGSNWYYMRYCDPKNNKEIASQNKLKYWMPVDWYNGGMEHTTLHLLYSRFIYKFLFDIGAAPQSEPYKKRTSQGTVLAEDGRKMSKSFGNVINPDDIVEKYGADTLRVYEMFMGPFDQAIAWNVQGVKGVYRFLEKIWKVFSIGYKLDGSNNKTDELRIKTNKIIKKVSDDIEKAHFNTAISSLMEYVNYLTDVQLNCAVDANVWNETKSTLLKLLSSMAPHIAEELWSKSGHKKSISLEKWPEADPNFLEGETFELIIQINGKMRDKITVLMDISEEEARGLTLEREIVKKWRQGKEIKKIIFVKNKLINIVI